MPTWIPWKVKCPARDSITANEPSAAEIHFRKAHRFGHPAVDPPNHRWISMADETEEPAPSLEVTLSTPKVRYLSECLAGRTILGRRRTLWTTPSKLRRAIRGSQSSKRRPNSGGDILCSRTAALVSPKKKEKVSRILLVAPRALQMASDGFLGSSERFIIINSISRC
jgi:hypothetical protein